MQILNGNALAAKLRKRVKQTIATGTVQPHLATVLVGTNPASQLYLKLKERACSEVGIRFSRKDFSEVAEEQEVIAYIRELNADSTIHGILVQIPLPAHMNPDPVIAALDPAKDVDGFHPANLTALENGKPLLYPVLVQAVLALIAESTTELSGKNIVFLSKSDVFTRPFQSLFARLGATCTVQEAINAEQTQLADILITALGRPHVVTGAMIKQGAVIIDIGITPTPEGIRGDVDQQSVRDHAGWITPVPGGVGPVTVAVLLENVTRAAGIAIPLVQPLSSLYDTAS